MRLVASGIYVIQVLQDGDTPIFDDIPTYRSPPTKVYLS